VSVHGELAVALLLLLAAACQPDRCPEDGQPCGGDPSGSWNVVNACRDPVFSPPVQVTYLGQPVAMARQPNPMMSSSDWCSSIVLGSSSSVTAFTFPHDTLSVSGGTITYVSDSDDPEQRRGTYQAVIKTTGAGSVDLSPACLTRSGTSLTCDMVTAALVDFAAVSVADPRVPCTDSPSEPASCQFYYSYANISCAQSAGGGCRCTYSVSFAGALNGRWIRTSALLTHSDASKMLPSQADYCVDSASGSMAMWGHDRTSILNQTGIRTLELLRAP
jgi:hypothetical protein